MTMGGSWEKTLKKLIGAAFAAPFSPIVMTKAIGRGTTKLHKRQ
jgi:hypothetical protein